MLLFHLPGTYYLCLFFVMPDPTTVLASNTLEIKYAAIASGFIFLWLLLEYILGAHGQNLRYYPYFVAGSLAVPAAGILMPIWRRKMYSMEGLRFEQAFKSGLLVTAVLTVTLPLIYFVFFKFIAPDLFENIRQFAHTHAHRFGLRPNVAMSRAEQLFNLRNYILAGFFGTMIYGSLIAGLGGYLFRTK